MRVKDAVGRFGEQVAAEHLQSQNWTIVDRNWRCRDGELDLVARDGSTLVFVEVKTRSSRRFGSPLEAVDRVKIARIRRLAARWLAEHRETQPSWAAVRFDVIAVVRDRDHDTVELSHVRSAF